MAHELLCSPCLSSYTDTYPIFLIVHLDIVPWLIDVFLDDSCILFFRCFFLPLFLGGGHCSCMLSPVHLQYRGKQFLSQHGSFTFFFFSAFFVLVFYYSFHEETI
ncbi:hypothetical protein BDQ17DRAFT_81810 [Cyathus striatus]|nr:hypothetical protein BDQ17DRAFT_81810 [Cyathus striatus]